MAHRLTLPCKEHPMPSPPSWSIARTVRLTRVTELWGPIADSASGRNMTTRKFPGVRPLDAIRLCIALNRWHPEAWHVPVREDGR